MGKADGDAHPLRAGPPILGRQIEEGPGNAPLRLVKGELPHLTEQHRVFPKAELQEPLIQRPVLPQRPQRGQPGDGIGPGVHNRQAADAWGCRCRQALSPHRAPRSAM